MHKILIAAACALTLAGCATRRQTEGTAVGAVGGAVVGGPVGAVVGGAAGAALTAPGAALDGRRHRCRWYDAYGRRHWRWC